MASISANGSRGHHKFTMNVGETYVSGGSENYSKVDWELRLTAVQSGWDWNISGVSYSVTLDGTTWNGTIPSYDGHSEVVVANGTKNVTHDVDGGRYIGFDFSVTDNTGKSYTPGNASANGGMNLTKIARYFSQTPILTLSNKTETSITINWQTSENASRSQYRIGTSGNWVDVETNINKRNGTMTISGLSPGTSYRIYGDFMRADSGLWCQTKPYIDVSTYSYPYISSAPNFIIGNENTIGIYNPLKRSVSVYIIGADNNQMGGDTITGTSITGYNNSSWKEWLYSTIPNVSSSTYKVRLVCSALSRDTTVNGGTYSVNVEESKPTFNLFEFEDVNSTTTALTGDSSVCVIGYSTIQATVSASNKAIAKNDATMSKYRLTIGNATPVEENYSDDSDVTMQIENVTSGTYRVSAIDSRNLTTYVDLSSPTLISYTDVLKDVNNSNVLRTGGVSEFVTLTLNGSIWYGNFGQVDNAIDSVTYRFKKSSDTTWVTGVTSIVPTLNQDGTFEFEGLIAGNNTNNGFDVDSVYNIEVTVTDKLSSTTYVFTLGSGIPHVAYARTGVSFMGKYDDNESGELQINGKKIIQNTQNNNNNITYSCDYINQIESNVKNLIKTQIFERTVTMAGNRTDYWDLGALSIPSGYTFLGILQYRSGSATNWITTFDTTGNNGSKVYAQVYNTGSQNTSNIKCTAVFMKNFNK